jgi:DEAD/DEAH box helicase
LFFFIFCFILFFFSCYFFVCLFCFGILFWHFVLAFCFGILFWYFVLVLWYCIVLFCFVVCCFVSPNLTHKAADIVFATPGRLWDLVQSGHAKISNVTYLVIEEADRLLDMGFLESILQILERISTSRYYIIESIYLENSLTKFEIDKYWCSVLRGQCENNNLRWNGSTHLFRLHTKKSPISLNFVSMKLTDYPRLLLILFFFFDLSSTFCLISPLLFFF